jgi:hypothetical protein
MACQNFKWNVKLELHNAIFNITYATTIFQELNNPEHTTLLYSVSKEKISCQQECHFLVSDRITYLYVTQTIPERQGSKLRT